MPFLVLSGLFLIILGVYIYSVKLVEKNCPIIISKRREVPENYVEQEGLIKLKSNGAAVIFLACCMFVSFLSSAVRYGLNNWIVSYLHEVFGFAEGLSMVVTIVLEVMAIIGPITMIAVCERRKNYISVMIVFYLIPFLIAVVMLFAFSINIFLSIVLLLIFEFFFSAAGAGLSVMSFDMRSQINIGSVSAFTNTTSSLAAGVVPTIVGALIDGYGWRAQYGFIIGMLFLMLTALVFFNIIIQSNKQKNNISQR